MVRIADIMRKGPEEEPRRPTPKPAAADKKPEAPAPRKEAPEPGRAPEVEGAKPPGASSLAYRAAVDFLRDLLGATRAKGSIETRGVRELAVKLIGQLRKDPDGMLAQVMQQYPGDYLPWHSVNVAILSLRLGLALDWEEPQLVELGTAALLHDIGMTQVSEGLIEKEGRLSSSEMEEVREHPSKGSELLARVKELSGVIAQVVAEEHERMDGKGYPRGLEDGTIHEYARIVAVVDVYEALTHPRSYRERYVPYEALKMMLEAGRTMFDPSVVKTLVEELSLYPVGSLVRLNTGETCRVVRVNKGFIMRPVVEVIKDAHGHAAGAGKLIDLVKQPMLHIAEAVREDGKAAEEKPQEGTGGS